MTELNLDPEQMEVVRKLVEAGDEQGILDFLMEEVDLFNDDPGIDQPLPARYDVTDKTHDERG